MATDLKPRPPNAPFASRIEIRDVGLKPESVVRCRIRRRGECEQDA